MNTMSLAVPFKWQRDCRSYHSLEAYSLFVWLVVWLVGLFYFIFWLNIFHISLQVMQINDVSLDCVVGLLKITGLALLLQRSCFVLYH